MASLRFFVPLLVTVLFSGGCAGVQPCSVTGLAVDKSVIAIAAEPGRSVETTVFAPSEPGRYPLIVFSHGAYAAPERYAALLRDWAAAGFVVAAPLHIDSELVQPPTPPSPQQVWRARQYDIRAIADGPPSLLSALPSGVSLAATPWIASGHSYGAFVAQAAAGATSEWDDVAAPSIAPSSVIALSPPGPIPTFIAEKAWSSMTTPQLLLTGTADVLPGFIDDWRLHAAAHEQAQGADQWLWVGTGVDHYFGRLMGRLDRDVAPQTAGFQSAQATMRDFLIAYGNPTIAACGPALTAYSNDIATLTRR
ncbi:MAG: hypothetical protein AAGC71_00425 [Pseudomonadota bacterium]